MLLILPQLGKGYCTCLKKGIITHVMQQNIIGAKNILEAVHYIREVSEDGSLLIEKILRQNIFHQNVMPPLI